MKEKHFLDHHLKAIDFSEDDFPSLNMNYIQQSIKNLNLEYPINRPKLREILASIFMKDMKKSGKSEIEIYYKQQMYLKIAKDFSISIKNSTVINTYDAYIPGLVYKERYKKTS